jgi:hypothetical protein
MDPNTSWDGRTNRTLLMPFKLDINWTNRTLNESQRTQTAHKSLKGLIRQPHH